MEFRFDLNDLFQEPVVEIGNSLIPPGFSGDKRALWDTQSKITQIVNAMGEASASAQGLTKPITTADRLRNSEHKLYLLIDTAANTGKGAVTGMLKTGEKGLYVFDREGQHYQVSPPCVLDFYVHESRQRSGFGKSLFEHMLQKQQIEPVKMAIDRPSDKLLGFLNKHYGLNTPVKQMNNYVVYDGFFPKSSETPRTVDADKSYTLGKKQSANGLQRGIPSSPYGRYGAPRPLCSMGQIIHNDSAVIKRNQEPTGVRSEPISNVQGQHNMYSSNQMPVWQATQSVPNMHYAFSQNQQNCAQIPQQQYAQNPQYVQYQRLSPNQNDQYPPSSGDYTVNPGPQQTGQPVDQNQITVQEQNQDYQQPATTCYAIAQGDATGPSHPDQAAINSTAEQIQNQNSNPVQYRQETHSNEAQNYQAQQNQNFAQRQPQVFTYQGQNYCFNPQTQQYHIIPSQSPQSLAPSEPQRQQQSYQGQMPVQSSVQGVPYGQQGRSLQQRERLIPQNLDGTVRKVQHSVSMPAQTTAKQNLPVMVHETASAPVGYHQQSAVGSCLAQNGVDQAYNAASVPQVSNLNETEHQATYRNQTVTPQSQYQPNPVVALPHNQINNQMQQQNQNMTPAPQSTPNTNQMMPNVNQMPTYPIQNVPQVPSISQVAVNAPNASFQPPNTGYTHVPPYINPHMTSQPVAQVSNLPQNSDVNQSSNVENMAQPTQNQVMTAPSSVNQPLDNRMVMQNLEQVPSMTQVLNVPMQQHLHQVVRHQPQNFDNQQKGMYANHLNDNGIVAGQQPTGNRVLGQDGNGFLQQNGAVESYSAGNVNVKSSSGQETRHARPDGEVDYSNGYPPQHHEKAAQNSTPKADRPQSLNIEMADDLEQQSNDNRAGAQHDDPLDGDHEDTDSFDADLAAIEREIEKIEVAPKEGTPKGLKSPGLEAARIVSSGRNTPRLTDQGYFDLKFYHNRLW